MDNYKLGDFGEAKFIAKKNFKFQTICHGTITGIEDKYISFTDNDDNEYIVLKSKFEFKKEEFKYSFEK
jgi:hypothetical protein